MNAPDPDTDLQRAYAECEREPIHLIGSVQPHGVLIVYQRDTRRVVAASANGSVLFGVDPLLDRRIEELLDPAALSAVDTVVDRGETRTFSQFAALANAGELGTLHELSAHVAGDLVHVELEEATSGSLDAVEVSHAMTVALDGLACDAEFHHVVADKVRMLVGYDRVMVYRFLHDNTGEVIAESCAADMPPYLGLRYPASDIPAQARQLYVQNRIRVIPDAGYAPVPVRLAAGFEGPLDMSFDVLRSVSPVHVEYLKNMGVAASMSLSLVVEGRLWGLIACHHRQTRRVSARKRAALATFGRHVSMILATRDLRESTRRWTVAGAARDHLEERLAAAAPGNAIAGSADALLAAVPADGFALMRGGEWTTGGLVPEPPGLDRALAWAREHAAVHSASTASIADWRGTPDDDVPQRACGLLAVRCSSSGNDWLLLFRREQREQVRWAGRPDEAFQLDASRLRIGPRTSFTAWEQIVAGSSAPWTDDDHRIAHRIRLLLDRYRRIDAGPIDAGGGQANAAAPDTRLLDSDVMHEVARLHRIAALLEEASMELDRGKVAALQRLTSALEREISVRTPAGVSS